jgi:hypothetical protein
VIWLLYAKQHWRGIATGLFMVWLVALPFVAHVVDQQPRGYPVLAASACDEKAIQARFPNTALKKLESRNGTGAVVAQGCWYLDQTSGGGLVHLEWPGQDGDVLPLEVFRKGFHWDRVQGRYIPNH